MSNWKLSPPANLQIFFTQVTFFARGDWLPKIEMLEFFGLLDEEEAETIDSQTLMTKFLCLVAVLFAAFAALIVGLLLCLRDQSFCKPIIDLMED